MQLIQQHHAYHSWQLNPREDADGLSREYVLRIPSVSLKGDWRGAVIYIHSPLIRRETIT